MEFTITDTVYMAMAVRRMLQEDMCKVDRIAYETLWMKLKLSHKGQRIIEAFDEDDSELARLLEKILGKE